MCVRAAFTPRNVIDMVRTGTGEPGLLTTPGPLPAKENALTFSPPEPPPQHGSCLGVLAEEDRDIGLVDHEMAVLADRAGAPHPATRRELQQAPVRG